MVTPVSANSGVDQKGFATVARTRIGSPYVIAGMEALAGEKVVGYEPNGGFLLGFETLGLAPLLTRDSFLPIVVPLLAAGGGSLADRAAREPAVFTASDRLQEVPTEESAAFVATLTTDEAARAAFLSDLGETKEALDLTDGLRISLRGGRVAHVRPSGNAPELRFYAEAESREAARELLAKGLATLRRTF